MTDQEMSQIIAEKVMGWERRIFGDCWGWYSPRLAFFQASELDWFPLTNASQAVQALKVMRDKGFRWHIESVEDYVSVGIYGKLANGKGEDKSFARAVCLAICEAVRDE